MKKKTLIIVVIAAVVAAAAVVCGILLMKNNGGEGEVSGSEGGTTEAVVVSGTASGEIKIPGFTEIEVEKNTDTVSIHLENPEGNPCSFVYEIVLKENSTVLYTSPSLAPGISLDEIKLTTSLPEGTYEAVIYVKTTSLADGTAMNGASFETVITAK